MNLKGKTLATLSMVFDVLGCTKLGAQSTRIAAWKEFSYPSDGFAITLPHDPHPHSTSQMANGTAYTVRFQSGSGLSIYTRAAGNHCLHEYVDPQASKAKANKNSDSSQTEGFTIVSFKDVVGRDFRGIEFVQKVPNGHMDYERWICTSNRIVIFAATWMPSERQPDEIKRIVDSFRPIPADR